MSCFSSSASDFTIRFEQDSLKLKQVAKLIEDKIPPKIKKIINGPVVIQFSALNLTETYTPLCRPLKNGLYPEDLIRGQTSQWQHGNTFNIEIDQSFQNILERKESESQQYLCGHKNYYRLALGTIIHQIGALFEIKAKEKHIKRLSENKIFLQITGWKKNIVGQYKYKNKTAVRVSDSLEIKNVSTYFNVNLEYYLLDDEFHVRRPLVSKMYKEYFGTEENLASKNEQVLPSTVIYLHSTNLSQNLKKRVDINPKRIYSVHYLFASKGESSMSRWGHAMLRLVVCAPYRKVVGPDCLLDTDYHISVGFRANVNDLIINYAKGLTGGYPSTLYMFPMRETIEEYPVSELRDLISLPLKLTPEQKDVLIYSLAETYWAYGGKYYFITNNCAVELEDLLNRVYTGLDLEKIKTPLGLYNELSDKALIDTGLVIDRKKAQAKGYLYPSSVDEYERSFSLITRYYKGHDLSSFRKIKKNDTWKSFVTTLTPSERKEFFMYLMSLNGTSNDKARIAANFKRLEEYYAIVINKRIQKAVQAKIIELQKDESKIQKDPLVLLLDKTIRNNLNSASYRLLDSGYGLPTHKEIGEIDQAAQSASENSELIISINYERFLSAHVPDLILLSNESNDNIMFYINQILAKN